MDEKRLTQRELPGEDEFGRMLDSFLPTLEGTAERERRERLEDAWNRVYRRFVTNPPDAYTFLAWRQMHFGF